MKKLLKIFLVFLFVNHINLIFAQDIILKKDNTQIKAKVIEIGKTEIKYRFYDSPDGPIITIDKNELKSIKIDGKTDQTIFFADDPLAVSNKKIIDKTKVLKFHMFSPLYGHIALSQEWMQKPGFNWEAGVGLIGAGYTQGGIIKAKNVNGFFLRGGPKFLFGNTEDVEVDGVNYKYAHPIKGRYFKIEGFYNQFTRTTNIAEQLTTTYTNTTTSTVIRDEDVKIKFKTAGLNFIYGRQFILGNTITLGYYIGFGYAFLDDKTLLSGPAGYLDAMREIGGLTDFKIQRYGLYKFKNNPLTFTSGLTIGYIFKYWPWEPKGEYKRDVDPSRRSMGK